MKSIASTKDSQLLWNNILMMNIFIAFKIIPTKLAKWEEWSLKMKSFQDWFNSQVISYRELSQNSNSKSHTNKFRCVEQRKVVTNIKVTSSNNSNKKPRSNLGIMWKIQNHKQKIKREEKQTHQEMFP